MPDWIFKNKPTAYATLASPSGTSGTTLTLTTGHGTRLPAPGAGQISAVRIENELITYTGNSGDVLTGVTRGAGATNHVAGTEVKNVLVEEWANAVTALSTDAKAALAGTSGTPQATNKFVTDADARNSNARTPTAHGHVEGDTTGLVADLAARVLTTDSRLSDARTPTTHAISHKATGGDVLAGIVGGYAPLDSGLLVPVANLGTGTPTGLKFLRDDRVWAVPAGGGGATSLDGLSDVVITDPIANDTLKYSGGTFINAPGLFNPATTAGDTLVGQPISSTNIATNGASGFAASNSPAFTGGTAADAFDSNDTTGAFWGSTNTTFTLTADLGSAKAIVALRAYTISNDNNQYTLQSSPDNATWTDRYTGGGDSGVVALTGAPIVARYWRLQAGNSGLAYIIRSFEVHEGTPAGALGRKAVGASGALYTADSAQTDKVLWLPVWQTLTDAATVTWNVKSGTTAQVTLGGSRTLAAPTNLTNGQTYTLHVVQDGTGSRTITWNTVFKWPGGTAPTLSTGAGKRDVFVFSTDGTNLYATAQAIDVR
jgi:hypothetical protein